MDCKCTNKDSCPGGFLCGYSLHLQLPQTQLKKTPEQVERLLEERGHNHLNQSLQLETVARVQKTNLVFGKSCITQLHHAAGWCQAD